MSRFKKVVAGVLGSGLGRRFFAPLLSGRLAVFMLHRFQRPDGPPRIGHEPALLREVLETLERYRIPRLGLREAVTRLLSGERVEGVVFTVDDGYQDFASIGAPVFRAFDCPVTVFVTTGFLDGEFWFWWDRLAVALEQTGATHLVLPGPGSTVLPLSTEPERRAAQGRVVEWAKGLPERERVAFLDGVFRQLDVGLPDSPPERHRPLTWDRVRELAAAGVEFAPHGVTHSSLASAGPERVRAEVLGSYARLWEERVDPPAIFCYPYGLSSDVSIEVARTVEESGLLAAVTALPGYVDQSRTADPFLLPRFSFPDRAVDFRQVAFGAERFKEIVRGRFR